MFGIWTNKKNPIFVSKNLKSQLKKNGTKFCIAGGQGKNLKQGPRCFSKFIYDAFEKWPFYLCCKDKWDPSSEFVSSSITSWQIVTAHAQPFRGTRDLAFYLKVPLDSLLAWASSGGSSETPRMRRLTWTFAARIEDKYQIRLTRPKW